MFKLIQHHADTKGLDFQAETTEVGTYGAAEINEARQAAKAQLPPGSSDWFTVRDARGVKITPVMEEAMRIWTKS